MASVQELILAAQAKQKQSPFSQLAQLINAGSEGYTQGLGIKKTKTDMANTQSEADLRRAEAVKKLIEAQQAQAQAEYQKQERDKLQQQFAATSEQDLRNNLTGVSKPVTPPTPVAKLEDTISVDEHGKISHVYKPKTSAVPNSLEEIISEKVRNGEMTLDDAVKMKKDMAGGSFMQGGINSEGMPVFYNTKDPTNVKTGIVPGGGILYPKTPSEGQGNAGTFGKRAEEANLQIEGLIGKGFDPTSLGAGAAKTFLPNMAQPENVQAYEQAKRNFRNAVLRKESGAAISPSEHAEADRQYFEVTGDSDEVKKQKAINRQTAIEGLRKVAGPMALTPDAPPPPPPPGKATMRWNPKTGKVEPI